MQSDLGLHCLHTLVGVHLAMHMMDMSYKKTVMFEILFV